MPSPFRQEVFRLTKKIPSGKVSTYKEIAKQLGKNPLLPRAVGAALKQNKDKKVPCHRVIRSDGSLGGFNGKINNPQKARLLTKENIKIISNKIDLKKYLLLIFQLKNS